MTLLVAMVRRSLWVVLLAAAGGAGYSWWRDRSDSDDLAPPEWPPLPDSSGTLAASATDASDNTLDNAVSTDTKKSANSDTAPQSDEDSAAPASTGTATSSFVNALVDAPEARSTDGDAGGWVDAPGDGSCPISHPVKANDNSGIFHVPGGRFYDRTKPERCYTSADAAAADGYRQAKN